MTSGNPIKVTPLTITDITATSALGLGLQAHWQALKQEQSGLRNMHFLDAEDLDSWIGVVNAIDEVSLPSRLAHFKCRNNQLAYLALQQDQFLEKAQQSIQEYGADRVGLFLGTSTSGILDTELAYREALSQDGKLPSWYRYQETHNNFSLTQFVSEVLGCTGVAQTLSTACSSSANVFATAERAIRSGFCDIAIVGGVDTLCLTTLYGFHSLQLLSNNICKPADIDRDGINIGEAAAFAILSPKELADKPRLLGYGESSDAHHMSSPHPEGLGARLAMESALSCAGLAPEAIDYINLHGTGTKANDKAESLAVSAVFGSDTPCSSTKGWTGHTLGAAGALEAAIACLCMEHSLIPLSLNTATVDPDLDCNIMTQTQNRDLQYVLSNSFGFGGNNCSLIFGG